jgi:hypothetical protein
MFNVSHICITNVQFLEFLLIKFVRIFPLTPIPGIVKTYFPSPLGGEGQGEG